MADKNSFVLYSNYNDILKDLPDEDAGKLFKASLEFQATGNIKELPIHIDLAFKFIKNQLDIDAKKYNDFCEKQKNNGLKGGAPKGNKNAKKNNPTVDLNNPKQPKTTQTTQNNLNDNDNDNDNVNDNVNDNDNDINNKKEKVKKEKKEFGEFLNVLLSEEEEKKLKELYKEKFEDAIETLSNYIKSNGKNYKNHYAVLRKNNWVYDKIFKPDKLTPLNENRTQFSVIGKEYNCGF